MSVLAFLLLLVVAAICGALGQLIVGGGRGGFLVSAGVGLVGALLGTWIAHAVRLPELLAVNVGGTVFPIVWAIVGSALLVAIISFVRRAA